MSKIIPIYCFLLTEAYIYHEVTSIVLGSINMYHSPKDFENLSISDYFLCELFLVDPLLNFLICSSLCYLILV